jgi:predicted nucleic acid-binding protein
VVVISCLARVEVPAAIWRKQRGGELTMEQATVLGADFEADYYGTFDEPERFSVVGLPPPLLDEGARLAAVHGLRAYDAVQLASATAARQADPGCQSFACFDRGLRVAARNEGLRLIPFRLH